MAGPNIKYVRQDCINAVDRLIRQADELPYVSAGLDGVYYSARNEYKDNRDKPVRSKGDAGSRLVIQLGGGDRDRVCYTFHMRDLSDPKNARARSLRYTPDGRDAVTAAWSMAEATIGEVKPLDAGELVKNTSRMMNSISFDAMFQGWGDGLLANTAEERSVQKVIDQGQAGGWEAVDRILDGGDPMDAMSAWGYMGLLLAGEGNTDPDSEAMTDMAYRAMGLDSLYRQFDKLNKAIAGDPDHMASLDIMLDPGHPEGRRALRGLACLSAYKEICDHGGINVRDAAGRHIVGVNMDDPQRAAVYDRLANTRAHAELYRQFLDNAEAKRQDLVFPACVQKTFAGIAREANAKLDKRVDNDTKYRLFRCAMLWEDPDLPSGMPAFKLDLAPHAEDIARLSPNDIRVSSDELPRLMDHMPLGAILDKAMEDPGGACGAFLARCPALNDKLGQPGGAEQISQRAVALMQGSGFEPVDGLVLELDVFQAGSKSLFRIAKDYGPSTNELIQRFHDNYQAAHQAAPQVTRSLDVAIGMPDFSRGVDTYGKGALLDLRESQGHFYPGLAYMGTDKAIYKCARAFRKGDAERTAACGLYKDLTGEAPDDADKLREVLREHGATGQFRKLMSACAKQAEQNPGKGAMMQNDILVLSDCYRIYSKDGLAELGADVASVYDGSPLEKLLYRPRDRAEIDALRAVYSGQGDDMKQAAVAPFAFQGERAGFLGAAWQGINGSEELKKAAVDKIRSYSLDRETLDDTPYSDLARELNGPAKSFKMMEAERSLGHVQQPSKQNEGPGLA